ncbi:MAG: helix-turn-helix transcriptional regulator [bacterium]|nr:helix-turn-helix transcriptional regulator [bacterium]
MTFSKALDREITAQGISVTEIAKKSGISKGTIYNILNGTTEEERIRPSTRRRIAEGCNRDLKVLPDGGVLFIEPDTAPTAVETTYDLALRFMPFRPFWTDRFCKEPFDWLHQMEVSGALPGLGAVDRVYQKREEFLSLVVENASEVGVTRIRFDLRIAFDQGPSEVLTCHLARHVGAGQDLEVSLFLLPERSFELEVMNPVFTDVDGQALGGISSISYTYRGE